ncbi:unnamed protein product [Chironomus riparius]|uniref:THAP-type domain-containing protein n=1 Tax=Chironomus riparius TaxID=315576 RepID=A0A9N9RP51_9DIPT|nr:unnamed protein product [Chironomus riparius]
MGKTCKIASCNKNKTITNLFKVPKHSLNKDKWLLFLKSNNISVDGSEIYLCDSHFKDDMIIKSNSRVRLTDNAYPSIDPEQQHPVKPKITIISNERVET